MAFCRNRSNGPNQMQTIYERVVSGEDGFMGAIGARSKKIFVAPPLAQFAFDTVASESAELPTLGSSTSPVDCISLSRDERSVAYGTTTVVKLFDVCTGREVRTLIGHSGRVNTIVQSSRTIYVWASASSDCTIQMWDTRMHPASILMRRLDRSANCARFSPDDAFIALGSDHVYMLDFRTRNLRSLNSPSQVSNICFHPSEYLLAASSDDRLVRFWDIDSGECVSQSEPADGLLRAISFHPGGSALFTLTDRRCGAISWEPFDILGQCSLNSCERALALAVCSSEVYVLGRSLSQNSLNVQLASVNDLLNEKLASEELLEPILQKESKAEKDEAISWGGAAETPVEEPDDESAFMPTRTLARTPPPQPFTLPASEETFVVSVLNSVPSPARPASLKTRPVGGNTRNGTKSSNAQNFAGKHSRTLPLSFKSTSGSRLASTSTTSDHHLQRKRSERENKGNRPQQTSEGNTETYGEEWLLGDISQEHAKLLPLLEQRKNFLGSLLQCWRTRGTEAAIQEAGRFGDTSVLFELITALNHSPAVWNLSLCSAVLPHINSLVASKHENYVEVALAALRTVISGYGNLIRMGTQQMSSIGVDITAEERHAKCIRCVQLLTEMRVKASILSDKMNSRHTREFTALMEIFDDTISPL